jgi:hypothetical protein
MHHFKTTVKLTRLLFILILILSLTACSNGTVNKSTANDSVDTTKSFKVDHYWLTPNKAFDFNSLGESSGDTLRLVTCSNYVYFPFGKLTDKSSISTSLLKDFTITSVKRDTFTNTNMTPHVFEWSESVDIRLDNNKLNLFLDNDPEASMHGYIRGGQIVDSKVIFSYNIKVGMSVEDFYKKFFDYFPIELNEKYNVVEFESCVTDIIHIYTFEKGQLRSVKFVSH